MLIRFSLLSLVLLFGILQIFFMSNENQTHTHIYMRNKYEKMTIKKIILKGIKKKNTKKLKWMITMIMMIIITKTLSNNNDINTEKVVYKKSWYFVQELWADSNIIEVLWHRYSAKLKSISLVTEIEIKRAVRYNPLLKLSRNITKSDIIIWLLPLQIVWKRY